MNAPAKEKVECEHCYKSYHIPDQCWEVHEKLEYWEPNFKRGMNQVPYIMEANQIKTRH